MNITLYNCSAENNKLNKTSEMTQVASYTGAVARQNLSIMNPVLVLQESAANINNANYCYISDFGRYYYIKEKTADVNGLFTLVLSVDVLMSFRTSILNQSGIVNKQENVYNMYLPSDVPSEVRPLISTVKMSPASVIPGAQTQPQFSTQSDCYVLLAIGGK